MKGDFSKDTFRKKKHFHDVHMQQGRVLLDSDWNEQADIYEHRIETGTLDIVGKAGAPYHDAGFDIIPVDNAGNPVMPPASGTNIKISEGRFYIDGIMCENDATVLFVNQPDYDKTILPTVPGKYLFYLDVWQRHITALEDSDLREVALGGPDTTTRNKTVWQVKFVKPDVPFTCFDKLPDFITNVPSGKLMARTELPTGTEDPCGLAVSGGYRRLENQLYRVEIHKGAANRAGTTFKWSRDNGSVVVKWESVEASDTNNLVVSSIGRDELLGFKSGDWIEMIDDKTDLLGLTGPLVQVSKVDGNVITINPATNIPGEATITAGVKNSRIRRWDSAGALKPNTNNTDWIELEDGVQVQFKEGSFRTGDYWLIPARTATADIEWPFTDHQSPNGIQHHYAKLGIAELVIGAAPGWVKISDCRPIFPPLTELITLNYVGGDGQEAVPGAFLDEKLKVAVSNGQWPVKNAKVKFKIDSGGGTLEPANISTVTLLTNADGIAECQWKLGTAKVPLENQRVKVILLDAGDNPIHLPLIFNAKLTPPALFYVSGDGQEAMPGANLPAPLKVGVAYEQFPVTGAKVKFIVSGGGSILPANAATTGINTAADGLASCTWKLGNSGLQQVTATLLDASNNPIHIPIIFNASLNVASNVAYDGGDCNNWLTPKPTNVADALTSLCKRTNGNSCSTYTVSPGDNVQAVFDQIPAAQDAHVCFQAGVYPLATSILVSNKGNLKVSGCGPGTKLVAANSEAALVFEKCKTVIVRDLYAETGKTGEHTSDLTKHLNGTLVFLGSSAVQIESVNLKCGYGPRKAAACITVRNDNAEIACSVTIRDCKLLVGFFQEGILLVNATRATVENNELSVYNRPLQMNFQSMLKDRYFRAGVRSYFAKNGPAEITPGRRSARAAAVNDLSGAAAVIGAGATSASIKTVWAKLLGAKKITQFRNSKAFMAHVDKTIDRFLKNENLRTQSEDFNARFQLLAEQSQVGIGTQGITVGGTVAKDIRILNNTVHGFLQGIHVGLSHRRVRNVERTDDIAEVITIAGNTVTVLLPPFTGKTERYGIFVGNCQDLIIENNTVKLKRMAGAIEVRINGIEVWGVFGQRLMVTKNMVSSVDTETAHSFDTGIFVKLLKTTWSISQFAVLWNVVPSRVQGVVADPEVVIVQNNKG